MGRDINERNENDIIPTLWIRDMNDWAGARQEDWKQFFWCFQDDDRTKIEGWI